MNTFEFKFYALFAGFFTGLAIWYGDIGGPLETVAPGVFAGVAVAFGIRAICEAVVSAAKYLKP
ncbi:MAG: hypothetical protein WBL19_03020 [Minisyncoccia bacterium]